jgi:hypothetical protein
MVPSLKGRDLGMGKSLACTATVGREASNHINCKIHVFELLATSRMRMLALLIVARAEL